MKAKCIKDQYWDGCGNLVRVARKGYVYDIEPLDKDDEAGIWSIGILRIKDVFDNEISDYVSRECFQFVEDLK